MVKVEPETPAANITNINNKSYHIPGRPQKIVELKTTNPNLTCQQIADLTDCDKSNVTRTLQRYNIDNAVLNGYKNSKADILAGIQERLLSSVSNMSTEALEKVSLKDRVVSAAILHDKELDIRQPGHDTMPLVTINQIIHVAK